jgi:predicted nucleotidyltransferase component of viral defense system
MRLGPFLAREGFYLGGGTALAVYLGHRKSVDLDWFYPLRLGDPLSWVERIREAGIGLTAIRIDKGTIHAQAHGTHISFFEYRYSLLHPLVRFARGSCNMASMDDLACMKLSAVTQRGSKKDFIDIYALMKKHASLGSMLQMYQNKFGVRDIGPVVYALGYFDDAEKERTPTVLWRVTWREMRKEIENALKDLTI